jgi:hypothetical protein
MGKQVPLPTMIFELEGMKELMEERLPDDDERCEDAPESMNQVASGWCRVIRRWPRQPGSRMPLNREYMTLHMIA